MALSILDGNQSATTLSTIVTSGQHIPAHTVVSLGTQAIANITSAISGTSVCVGSISISGTPSVTGSVSVLNFPASQSTTFGAVTGSVSVLNFPASQSVTFGATTGSISVLNFPASQAVTFGQAIVSASNITGLNNSVGTDAGTPTSTNFIKIGGHQDGSNSVEHIVHVSAGGAMKVDASDSTVTFGTIRGTVTIGNSVTISSLPAISGTVSMASQIYGESTNKYAIRSGVAFTDGGDLFDVTDTRPLPVCINDTSGNSYGTSENPLKVSGTVTIGAGTAQIGSVTASISGTVPISISSVTVGNSVTIGSLPAISGTVTANAGNGFTNAVEVGLFDFISNEGVMPISGTVTANTFAVQGTAVTTSNFTSTTASTVLASFNATREVLTIFNEGAGNLHICAGATCTTIAYQVRLSAGDYYEVPNHQTTITHSAVFATAGTARVTEVS